MPRTLRHELVNASAGFGKTHRLVSRLLALLVEAGGPRVSADRIAALTFSRAAAGEIFDTLVRRLADASIDEGHAAAEYAANSELASSPSVSDCRDALSRLLRGMHTTFIGTIDSFFLKVIQAFGPELGIPGEATLVEDHPLAQCRERILGTLLACSSSSAGGRAPLAEAFKRASYGQETKRISEQLAEWTRDWHQLLLRAPESWKWGDPHAIWGRDMQDLWNSPPPLDDIASSLRASLLEQGQSDKQMAKWEELIEAAASFTPTTRIPLSKLPLFDKLVAVADDLAAGTASITNFKTVDLSARTCRHALDLVRHIQYCELRNRLRATAGVHELLARYDDVYNRELRQRGRFGFDDVPWLLAGRAAVDLEDWDPARPAASMAYVNYRLDGQLDHWALDEFQDTSRQQWQALQDLVEEALHAPPPERTFFAVGDPKQAIYGWRGGDVRLMDELRNRYGTGAAAPLRTSQLPRSYRSSQSVLNVVNAVFGDADEWPVAVPESVRRRWSDETFWRPHEAARDTSGFAAVVQTQKLPRDQAAASPDPRHAATAGVLRELDPESRGLTAAVLVRSNREGVAVTRFLRDRGIDARWDGDALIADNPVVSAVLDSFRAAAHPGDTLAANHREMTPLAPSVTGTPSPAALLRTIEERGFEAAVDELVAPLRNSACWDRFCRFRVRQLAEAAQQFDATGSADVVEFEEFVRSFTVRDLPPETGVRVMTMHRSKGLGFDAVILPDLDAARIDDIRTDGLTVAVDPHRPERIEWVLDLPPKVICEAEPVLSEHRRRLAEDNASETLCLLYVAMTRAKRGLYLVTAEPGPSSGTLSMGSFAQRLVQAPAAPAATPTLGWPGLPPHAVLHSEGDPDWHRRVGPAEPSAESVPKPPAVGSLRARPVPLHCRRLPSAGETATPAVQLFSRQSETAAGFGTVLHALFEQIAWLDTEPFEAAVERGRSAQPQAPPALLDEAERTVRSCLNVPAVAAVFQKPPHPVRLRREQAFELLLEGRWVSGVFDRIVLPDESLSDADAMAGIVDFKSDRIAGEDELASAVDRHRPQMALYRRALAAIAGIPVTRIRVRLLFTHPRRVVDVPCETMAAP